MSRGSGMREMERGADLGKGEKVVKGAEFTLDDVIGGR